MKSLRNLLLASAAALAFATVATTALPIAATAVAAEPTHVTLAWTHYTGWEPWGWIQNHKTAQKAIEASCGAGSSIDIKLMGDYAKSLNLYASKGLDGVAATTMDSLTTAGVGGVATDFLVVSDYSDGNDAIIAGDPSVKTVADLKGKSISLVQFTVSHYLLDRALDDAGLKESQVTVENKSDADIGTYFAANPKTANVVTWNPIVMSITKAAPKAKVLFTSKQIPGEIVDAMVVRDSLPDCAKTAIKTAWFDAVAKLRAGDPAMLDELAAQADGTVAEFQEQVATTHFFWTPADSATFVAAPANKATMDRVRRFSFDHGLYNGVGVDAVGIGFPDGVAPLGDPKHVVVRFSE